MKKKRIETEITLRRQRNYDKDDSCCRCGTPKRIGCEHHRKEEMPPLCQKCGGTKARCKDDLGYTGFYCPSCDVHFNIGKSKNVKITKGAKK